MDTPVSYAELKVNDHYYLKRGDQYHELVVRGKNENINAIIVDYIGVLPPGHSEVNRYDTTIIPDQGANQLYLRVHTGGRRRRNKSKAKSRSRRNNRRTRRRV